jgi:hypothetical protein
MIGAPPLPSTRYRALPSRTSAPNVWGRILTAPPARFDEEVCGNDPTPSRATESMLTRWLLARSRICPSEWLGANGRDDARMDGG